MGCVCHGAMDRPSSKLKNAFGLAAWIVLTFLAPSLGAFSLPGDWYAALNKPTWNPPSWVFGPAWTLLYTLMAVSAWLVWKRGGFGGQRVPLTLYLTQLVLNAAWTPIFFGAHALGWALAEIVVLWIAILLTLLSFRRVSTSAALLFVPYLAWVTFASVLNFTLWQMNRG